MSIKNPSRNKNTSQNRRSARFSVDLSFPMIFCVSEAIILLALLIPLDLFFDFERNNTSSLAILATFFCIYLVTAGVVCIFYLFSESPTGQESQIRGYADRNRNIRYVPLYNRPALRHR